MKFNLLAITTFSTLLLSACYYDSMEELYPEPVIIPGINDSSTTVCDTAKIITYTNDIKQLFSDKLCLGCHTGGGGTDLSTYQGALAASSKLIGAVTWDGTARKMPDLSISKIDDCSIAKIKRWVNTGTKE